MGVQEAVNASGLHTFGVEGGSCVLDERDVVAEFHPETRRRLNAGVRDKANQNDFLDVMLLQKLVEIGIGEAILRPMLVSDNISGPGPELRMPLAAPGIDCEDLLLLCLDLRWIDVQPFIKIIIAGPVMRNDEDLDPAARTAGINFRMFS